MGSNSDMKRPWKTVLLGSALALFTRGSIAQSVTASSVTINNVPKVSVINSNGVTVINSAITESGGNVGIGMTNPAASLTVNGPVNTNAASVVVGAGSDTATGGGFGSMYSVGTNGLANQYKGFWWQLGASNQLRLFMGNSGANGWINPFTVDTLGNVGIATTT